MSHTRSRCPCCNSILGGAEWRDGVRLPATQLRIYDAVKGSGRTGVSGQALEQRLGMGRHNLKAQIWRLNENLSLVDRRVRAGLAGCNYRLVEWPTPTR